MNILIIAPNFNLACGVSKHVYTLLTSEELKKEFNLYFITNGGDALSKLDNAKVNYSILDFKTDKILHLDFFRNIREIKKFCIEKNIHLIHSHHRYPDYLSYIIKKSLGVKTVMTVHNFVTGYKYLSYNADKLISISKVIANHLIDNFQISSERINVLYNCVKKEDCAVESKLAIKSKLNILGDKRILLYGGRFIYIKGINVLLSAFKLLSEFYPDIYLIMVGDKTGSSDLIRKLSLTTNQVSILPPYDNFAEYYNIADIVILPSFKEGLGYTMLEAGLNKLPFIGSRTGGISEFIEDEIDGFLFESGNGNDLADKIKFVLDNPEKSRDSAIMLNEKVLRLCNCANYFQKLSNIYHRLLTDL